MLEFEGLPSECFQSSALFVISVIQVSLTREVFREPIVVAWENSATSSQEDEIHYQCPVPQWTETEKSLTSCYLPPLSRR